MKRSLLELRKLRARIEELEHADKEPIAIVGMGCHFPGGARDPDAFWDLLRAGRDAIVETPASRWDLASYYDPDPTAPGKTYVRHGGFLDNIDNFDFQFFGISRLEAVSLDPQQRILLEVAWEALEHAGQSPDRLYGTNGGVFVGIGSFEHAARLMRADASSIDPYFGTGAALSAAAGRISFTLGMTGPSMAIDTACSSSLVAVHLACHSLRARECDLALAGGVNLMVIPEVNIAFSKARMLAPDGRCKAFDAAANGYVRSEGCGLVVLKRLSDAVANSDHIVALIRGSAVNQDGPSGALVVPNGLAQQAVLRKALENANVTPDDVDYIEAHGTGTSLGDPIEIGALARVFGNGRPPNRPLVLGSVKTNVGHLECAAGVAGMIKVALSLHHETIPPHLHFKQPNPQIPWNQLPGVVPTEARPWPRRDKSRFAGLSSFGFTGTNAHVILQEAPPAEPGAQVPDRPAHVFTLSAKSGEALRGLATRFLEYLAVQSQVKLRDVCFSANTGRARFRHRLAIAATSLEDLRGKLEAYIGGRECTSLFLGEARTGSKCKTAFIFTNDNTAYVGIGGELCEVSPTFRQAVERCGQVPPLSAFEIALAQVWESWGIRAAAVTGWGLGERVAAQHWLGKVGDPDVRELHRLGFNRFVEIGPESGLGRDDLPRESVTWISGLRHDKPEWQQIAEKVAVLSTQEPAVDWVAFDREYPCRRIPLPTYPFQRERCWIQTGSRNVSEPRSGNYYRVAWEPQDTAAAGAPLEGSWLILADHGGVGRSLAAELEARGAECSLLFSGQTLDGIPQSLRGAIHLWALDETQSLGEAASLGCGGALQLVQALARHNASEPQGLCLVTRGAQAVVSAADLTSLPHAPLWGLGKGIGVELPWLSCKMIDLDPAGSADDVTRLLTELSRGADQVAFRAARRYVGRLVRADIAQLPPTQLKPDRTYLITGGLGGVGLRVAHWMVEHGARHLALLGRSDPSGDSSDAVQEIRHIGAEVVVFRADVSRANELADTFDLLAASMPPLAGVVHCAGIFNDRILLQHEWDLFAQVFAPKVQGSWNLHTLTRDMNLDFFVLFSSAAALLPSPGMSSYVAANAFLDALAQYRNGLGLPALSIGWGPWQGTGMAQRVGRSRENQWRAHGVEPLCPSRALENFGLLLGHHGHLGVFSVQWSELLRLFSGLPIPPYLQKIAAEVKTATQSTENPIFRRLLDMSTKERTGFLETYLNKRLLELLGSDAELSNADNLPQAGVDSLMMMDVLNSLRDDLRFMVYPREFYEQPTIQGLARYLAAEFERAHCRPAISESGTAEAASSSFLSAAVESFAARPAVACEPACEPLPGVIFILSSPRSGSTLLRVMLAGHPALFAPPELHLLPFATMRERARLLGNTHLGEGLQRALMSLRGLDAEASRITIEEWVQQNLPIREVYATLQQEAGSRLLIDKSPSYAASREILTRAERLFDGARYIHLVRHPYAAIESFVRLRMDKLLGADSRVPLAVAEEIWTTTNRNIIESVASKVPERYHRIYYEDLVRNPESVLSHCCQFLGVPFDKALLAPYTAGRMAEGVHTRSAPVGDPDFFKHDDIERSLGERWKQIDLGRQLKSATRALAADFGYELSHDTIIAGPRESYLETVRGLRLCLCHWGNEGDPLILLLHGILEQGAAWMEVAPIMAEQGFHVVAPDLRGHGHSDHVGRGGSYQVMDFVADVDAIVTRMGSSPLTLVGHSLGSVIAALFVCARPSAVRSLVLIETPIPEERPANGDGERLGAVLDYFAAQPHHPVLPDVGAVASRMMRALPGLSQPLALKLAERNTVAAGNGLQWRWDPLLGTRAGLGLGHDQIGRARYLELLGNLVPPVTMVFGSESTLKTSIAGVNTVVLPGGHNLHLEQPTALADVIARAAAGRPSYEFR
jgi:acyl transferase domain-containing protein/pimeloyl-ACP methyl ester carboxylesterase/aryl carrier-like protein